MLHSVVKHWNDCFPIVSKKYVTRDSAEKGKGRADQSTAKMMNFQIWIPSFRVKFPDSLDKSTRRENHMKRRHSFMKVIHNFLPGSRFIFSFSMSGANLDGEKTHTRVKMEDGKIHTKILQTKHDFNGRVILWAVFLI